MLGSASHLVEIDLLRGYPSLPMNSESEPSDYYILVSAASQRPQAQLYPFGIQETFPSFQIPLEQVNESVLVDMQIIFEGVIERASYDMRIDYAQPAPLPPLSIENKAWVQSILKSHQPMDRD